MSNNERNIIEYIVCCVSEFAERHQLSHKQSYAYLRRYLGIQFLREQYEIEHTFSIDDAVDDLTRICQHNGGQIA
ncbi:MAG: DUF3791 domain-containing protein [Bacteroidales bacterium]|nr:DUF3791 domain-containing protein [Bacteroidales bacterium]